MDTSFERNKGIDEWLTPPYIIEALGSFNMDPCSPVKRPWDTAKNHYTKKQNGLLQVWKGRVWCNPPYGTETAKWLEKCSKHKNAIALTFARTETKMFFEQVWNKADAVFFIKGRLNFYTVKGIEGDSAGSPSVLIAYGKQNARILQKCGLEGKFIQLK
ncbi:DNA N-6-adenine-methyltransferase [Arcicella lustrica]|uniref:DNA N-6-adenine-methyltransferase n=1 Tax=Arcicella lustrica TaxID=2984196 RepID=A0ABU5SDP7_9BACT|nr:DNA N-6-adenine-methyltransferase [Arcicella sp. DC25W]MEA5425396.1 DNA N-6-adenine-methyltransferase [Arcicella sp. DC25W]